MTMWSAWRPCRPSVLGRQQQQGKQKAAAAGEAKGGSSSCSSSWGALPAAGWAQQPHQPDTPSDAPFPLPLLHPCAAVQNKEKVNNLVLFDKPVYDKLLAEVPKYKMITQVRACVRWGCHWQACDSSLAGCYRQPDLQTNTSQHTPGSHSRQVRMADDVPCPRCAARHPRPVHLSIRAVARALPEPVPAPPQCTSLCLPVGGCVHVK